MDDFKKLWPHDKDDKTTWKYCDVIIGGNKDKKTLYVKKWVLNPDFKYKHLDPSYQAIE